MVLSAAGKGAAETGAPSGGGQSPSGDVRALSSPWAADGASGRDDAGGGAGFATRD